MSKQEVLDVTVEIDNELLSKLDRVMAEANISFVAACTNVIHLLLMKARDLGDPNPGSSLIQLVEQMSMDQQADRPTGASSH